MKKEREDFAACMVLVRYAGFRLHEVLRIDTAIAHAALTAGFLTIKGKSGKIREVPINNAIQIELEKFFKENRPGNKLFVPREKQTHRFYRKTPSKMDLDRSGCQMP